MKKIIITLMTILMTVTTVNAAEIPIESTPCYATTESTVIAERLICDILDEVKGGMGFADAMNKANNRICNLTSAPNYTEAGYYPVYYEIDYHYDGESMTENGVSYVWLLADSENDNNNGGDIVVVVPPAHEHDYHYLETVEPSCENLGYDVFQCNGCGQLKKSNYKTQKNHNYKSVTIREATCKQGGLKLWLCENCGDFYEETTPVASHSYKIVKHNATCRITGYTEHICEICSENFVTDITPIINHSFERITKEPTCIDKGYTTSTCTMCAYHYVSDYTDSLGHAWDDGHKE